MGVVEQVSALPSVVKDAPDLRDQVYLPSLRPLPSELPVDATLVRALKMGDPLNWLPRDQGEEGTCAAQAAATLIDLQRIQTARPSLIAPQVSARMLYQMAIQQNYERQTDGVCLRDVIKGFYHNGVCSEELWRYKSRDTRPPRLTIKRAKDARKISLGAYYRLRPSLNDYHAALNDVGPILVSAGIHEGWSKHLVARRDGHINPNYPQSSAHAFVIVGYDSKGFLVLNSWGKRWGGFLGCPGVAHWRYDDWADNIFDGWVLRLGVSTPAAFPYTIGEQGIYIARKPTAAASTPAFQVRGHLIHLDDGSPVSRSRYPYDDRTIAETCRYLAVLGRRTKTSKSSAERSLRVAKYRGVVLKLCGSLLGLDDIAREINREKEAFKRKNLYPLTVAWCNDFVEKTSSVLSQLALEATKQVDTRSSGLDTLIESHIRGVGRAFWRDVERASAQSTTVDGPLSWAVTNLLRLEGFSVHILSDGAGAMLLCDLIDMLERDRHEDFLRLTQMIRTVDLIAPTITADRLSKLLRSVGTNAKATLHVPNRETEARLSVGMYSKSILQLIENAFCSTGPEDRPNFVGKSMGRSGIQSVRMSEFPGLCINEISVDAPYGQFLSQNDLYSQSNLLPGILERISPVKLGLKPEE